MLYKKLFPGLVDEKWAYLNLNQEASLQFKSPINPLVDPIECEKWVNSLHKRDGIDYSYGGYLEDRQHLWRDHYQMHGYTVHIGIDYNVPVGTPVHLPQNGELICVEKDPDQRGGWGTRAIYMMGGLFVTFAHLSLVLGNVSQSHTVGDVIGYVGSHHHNGGWYPHLHVQVQRFYNPSLDGYQRFKPFLLEEFPDPEKVLC